MSLLSGLWVRLYHPESYIYLEKRQTESTVTCYDKTSIENTNNFSLQKITALNTLLQKRNYPKTS